MPKLSISREEWKHPIFMSISDTRGYLRRGADDPVCAVGAVQPLMSNENAAATVEASMFHPLGSI
jgi:hypothetical protein